MAADEPKRKKQKTTTAKARNSRVDTLYLVWKVEVTKERYDAVEKRELYSISKSRKAAEDCKDTIKRESLEDGLDWDEEEESGDLGSVYHYAKVEEYDDCRFPSNIRKVWAVLKTTVREGQGWVGMHQYDYDSEEVELIGIFTRRNEAEGAANEDDDEDEDCEDGHNYSEHS
ncbi:MAG: hypothetical protein SGARI_002282, partial [Bacillariaceae sp.]